MTSDSSDTPPDRLDKPDRFAQRWVAPVCRVRRQSRTRLKEFDIEGSFSLIGSHPCCPIRVRGTAMPPVVYFVCCLRTHIEIWPMATVAFPRWGAIRSTSDLLVGQYRIQLLHPAEQQTDSAPPPSLADDEVHTTLTYKDSQIEKRFRRPVTLIGDSHPSVVRVNGWGLEACQFAAVVQDRTLWIVDLSAQDMPLESRIQRLSQPGDKAQMRDVVVEFVSVTSRKPEAQPDEQPDVQPDEQPDEQPDAQPAAQPDPQSDVQPNVIPGTDVRQRVERSDTPATIKDKVAPALPPLREPRPQDEQAAGQLAEQPVALPDTEGVDVPAVKKPSADNAGQRGAHAKTAYLTPAARASDLQQRLTQREEGASDASEALTSRVTDRLISIRHTRSLRRRILLGLTFLATIGGTAYFLFWLLRNIHWDWF